MLHDTTDLYKGNYFVMSEPKPNKTPTKEVSSKEVKKTDSSKIAETKQDSTVTKKETPSKSASQSSISHFSSVSTPAYRSGWEKIFGNNSKSEVSKKFKANTENEVPKEILITNDDIDSKLRVLLEKAVKNKANELGIHLIDEEISNDIEYDVVCKIK